jgi:cytoskeletal protein CcmA (bactofilin family)
MFSRRKGPNKDADVMVSAVNNAGPMMSSPTPPSTEELVSTALPSSIGSQISIVGTIDCRGPAQIFGRVEGELRGSEIVICEGARIDGNVVGQDVTICGRVKGTVRGVRVKLQDGGAVEGDIFHRSLSIDDKSLFEGVSRRVENPLDECARATWCDGDTAGPRP